MACLLERKVVNPRYKKISPDHHYKLYNPDTGVYPRQDYIINVDCGRCINCFRKYMSSWRFRLMHEFYNLSPLEISKSYFVTLTIEPKYYTEKKPALKKMVRLFLERVRKHYKKSIRHFLVTERGENFNRLHFHGFFINTDVPPAQFYKLWKYGFVKIKSLSDRSTSLSQRISYCTSYVTKGKKGVIEDVISPEDYPLVLVSPGLGLSYVNRHKFMHIRGEKLYPFTFEFDGTVRSLPRYLRGKVFDDKQRRLMANDYFSNLSDDVIPDPPYFIGSRQYDDYTVYQSELSKIKLLYSKIYGK